MGRMDGFKNWTPHEDDRLVELALRHRRADGKPDFVAVAKRMGNRLATGCQARHFRLMKRAAGLPEREHVTNAERAQARRIENERPGTLAKIRREQVAVLEAERERAKVADHRDNTGWLQGDPQTTRSALWRKQHPETAKVSGDACGLATDGGQESTGAQAPLSPTLPDGNNSLT